MYLYRLGLKATDVRIAHDPKEEIVSHTLYHVFLPKVRTARSEVGEGAVSLVYVSGWR